MFQKKPDTMNTETSSSIGTVGLNADSSNLVCCDKTFNTKSVFKLHKYVKHAELDIWNKKVKLEGENRRGNLNKKIKLECEVRRRGKYKKKAKTEKERVLVIKDLEPCPYCGKTIATMAEHIKNIHTGEIRKCPKCRYTSRRKGDIDRHYDVVHTAKTREICGFCGKVYKKLSHHLQVTMCGRETDDRERFTCDQCNVTVIGAPSLKKHKYTIHESIKKFKCELCQYATYTGYNLRLHENKVHNKSPIKTEVCPICAIKTGKLKEHFDKYHSE